jgi:hypothetical protein
MGASLKKGNAADGQGEIRPEELCEDVDFGGLSLQAYAEESDRLGSARPTDVHSYTAQSIEECMFFLQTHLLIQAYVV